MQSRIKTKWTKYCVLSANSNDNANNDDNANNIIFTIKDTKLYVYVVTLSAKENQKLSKLLRNSFERSVYWNGCKTKSRVATLLETPGNLRSSWKLLEKLFFFNFPWKSPGKSQGHQIL